MRHDKVSNRMNGISTKERIDEALKIVSDLAQKHPDQSSARVVLDQLRYLKDIYERDGGLRSVPKGKLTIGLIAAREYDTENPELADLLYKIDWAIDHQ
jgi:hypothetical protein